MVPVIDVDGLCQGLCGRTCAVDFDLNCLKSRLLATQSSS